MHNRCVALRGGVWQHAISEKSFCQRRLSAGLVEANARSRRRNLLQKRNLEPQEVISFRSTSLEKELGFLGSRHGDEGNFQRLSLGKLCSKKLAEFGKTGDKQQHLRKPNKQHDFIIMILKRKENSAMLRLQR